MILAKIVKHKRLEIEAAKKKKPLATLKKEVLALPAKKSVFMQALEKSPDISVIAEIKKRSPSRGLLRKSFKPLLLARDFEKSGARALSVLTDGKFFGGSAAVLKAVKKTTNLPVLRKDFILDEYQVWESRLMGADAVLLIACLLSALSLQKLAGLAERLGLDVLYEAHTGEDVLKILKASPKMIGINNRDLRTFRVDIRVTGHLVKRVPKGVLIVSESGIWDKSDMAYLKRLGVKAALVGESLMKEKSPGQALKKLLGRNRGSR